MSTADLQRFSTESGIQTDRTARGDEGEIIAAARSGDSLAFELLLRRYEGLLRARARRFFLQGADHEDLLQEAMIGFYKAVRDFQEHAGSFRSFVELCVSRQIITAVKTASRQKHLPLNSAFSMELPRYGDADGPTFGDSLGARDNSIDSETLGSAEVRAIFAVLKQHLSTFEFGALMLWLDGWAYQEIARKLGKHTKSVDNGLWRVKCKVRRLLTKGLIPVGH